MKTPAPGRSRLFKDMTITLARILGLLACLYFFICSLSFLSDSFRILGGKNIGALFSNSDLLKNPVVGLMIGVLVTVLVQSSSTSTSIIVGLVSAGAPVRTAIPMIMGANIGTSVTNIIVALTQAGDREQFRKAFACANVHDMFNWLSAFTLLILEVCTNYLETISGWLVADIGTHHSAAKSPDFLKALTKPLTKVLIQLDKDVLKGWAENKAEYRNVTSVLKLGCEDKNKMHTSCSYLFAHLGPEGAHIGETYIGLLLLGISLTMLCGCLIGMVKILNSLLGERVRGIIENVINADIPVRGLGWLTGYLAMVVGAIMTILVQSSSVFTSTLTPLAGAGLVSLERAYPLTLGSNLGTTTTSILASFAAGGDKVQSALQIALVHLLFNLTGIILFYPVPVMRWPISIARVLGNTTAQYRWFAVVYLCFMFFIFPLTMFGLSMCGSMVVITFTVLLVTLLAFSVTVTKMQTACPNYLPALLRSWAFLPLPLHSLDPWDRVIVGALGCCCSKRDQPAGDDLEQVIIHKKSANNGGAAPLKDFPSVVYKNLPHQKVLKTSTRSRSSASFSIASLPRPARQRSSHSFSNSSTPFTDLSYNRLAVVDGSKSPTPGESSGEATPTSGSRPLL